MAWFEFHEGSWLWRFVRILIPSRLRFDLYTTEAGYALFFARESVTDSGGTLLLPEHLLIGVLRCDPSLTQRLPALSAEAAKGRVAADRPPTGRAGGVRSSVHTNPIYVPFSILGS